MSSHFLLSAKARTLSLSAVLRMTEEGAETAFMAHPLGSYRWQADRARAAAARRSMTAGSPTAPRAGAARRAARISASPAGRSSPSTRCRCGTTSRPSRSSVNEVKGKSRACALSRDLDVQYKTAFVLAHKLREAMASELKGLRLGGDGETVEVDGGYFGGYIKPANHRENRRRPSPCQAPDRQAPGRRRDARAGRFARCQPCSSPKAPHWAGSPLACRPDTRLMADEAKSWNDLHARFAMEPDRPRPVLQPAGRLYTNGAEEFFSRMRRAEIGHHHHIAGPYLVRYAQESAWREDHRRVDNGRQVQARHGAGDGVPAVR